MNPIPPYPSDNDTAARLYERLQVLAAFLDFHREKSNRDCGENPECIGKPQPLTSLKMHVALPVRRHNLQWKILRKIRQQYDKWARTFEDCPDSPAAKTSLHSLLHAVRNFVHTVHMSREMAEAYVQTGHETAVKAKVDAMAQQIKQALNRAMGDREEGEEELPEEDREDKS